jgi:hypothetical protein
VVRSSCTCRWNSIVMGGVIWSLLTTLDSKYLDIEKLSSKIHYEDA